MNPIPPYVSLDLMRATQRELYEEKWGPLGPYDGERPTMPQRAAAPDPIGMAMMKLRPVERLHGVWDRVARINRLKQVIGRRPGLKSGLSDGSRLEAD